MLSPSIPKKKKTENVSLIPPKNSSPLFFSPFMSLLLEGWKDIGPNQPSIGGRPALEWKIINCKI